MSPTAEPSLPTPIRYVTSGHGFALVRLTLMALLSGLVEAFFLVLVTRAAFTVADGSESIDLLGDLTLSLGATIVVASVLLLVRLALSIVSNLDSAWLFANVVTEVRRQIAEAFLRASWTTQQSQRGGSLQELTSVYSGSAAGLIGSISHVAIAGANLVGFIVLAVLVDPLTALVVVVIIGLLGTAMRPVRKLIRRHSLSSTLAGMEMSTSVNEVSQLGLELHVFAVQDEALGIVRESTEKVRAATKRLALVQGLVGPVYTSVAYFALVIMLAIVSFWEPTNLESFGAILLVMLRSLGYGQALQRGITSASAETPRVEELLGHLRTFDEGRRRDGGEAIERIDRLVADRVWFSYTPGQPVLHDISFSIDPHEIIGIIGPSGGGKSTLVQLLLGLRDPDEGSVLLDGRPIGEFAKGELARHMTFVPQAAHLISGTIAGNIRFLRAGVSDEDVVRAARLAHLHEEIDAFPEKYERRVGEGGNHLSGGQEQRLCLARALVERPDVLILDEPTSALDVRSEHLVRSTLLGLKQEMTVIVIAHRLSTLDICDRLMVIKDGRLHGFEAPAVLQANSEFYREALELSGLRR